jgi:hypothetical protein
LYFFFYFNYDSFGGTWYDAEKPPGNNMCWAASASNILMWTGWNAGFSDADAIFTEFRNDWTNSGQSVMNALSWWFNGTYTTATGWGTANPGSGNFYPNDPLANYFHVRNDPSTALSDIDTFLHSGDGVSITISTPLGLSHVVTVWGYEYDAQGNYLGIYITDSDNNIKFTDPTKDPDTRLYYQVTYNTSEYRWYLQNYDIPGLPWWGSVYYILDVKGLDRMPVATPEPATMLLLGSGLLGLAGYGRKKLFKK